MHKRDTRSSDPVIMICILLRAMRSYMMSVSCKRLLALLFFFFFFQAEDGIRDRNVTGVQTCALPISLRRLAGALAPRRGLVGGPAARPAVGPLLPGPSRHARLLSSARAHGVRARGSRSEERRVGKECRCGGGRYV